MLNLDAAVGIEIGDRRLVLSPVTKKLRGLKVAPHLILEDFQELGRAELHTKIQDFVSANSLNTENVIVGVGRNQVVVKELELPLEVEENLDQVVKFQVHKLEPSDNLSICYDYLVLNRDDKAKKLLLQIVLVPRETVDEVVTLLAELGLRPAALRLSSLGLHQLMGLHEDGITEHPSIILRCEKDEVEALLVNGTGRHFSQYRPADGQADQLALVTSALDDLLSRVDLNGVEEVQGIYLTGSGGRDVLEPVREKFGAAELLSDGVKLDLEGVARGSLALTGCAVGLAVSSLTRNPFSKFNLIPPEIRRSRTQLSYVPTMVLAVLMLFLVGLSTARGYLQQSQLLAGYSARADELKPLVEWVTETRGEADQLSGLAVEMSTMLSGRQLVLSVLKELTALIPDDAYLQSVHIETSKVNMTGFSEDASSLIPVLQQSNCLTKVESKYITRDRRSGKDKFSFEASIGDCSL